MILKFLGAMALFFLAAIIGASPKPIGLALHNPGNIRSAHPERWAGAIGRTDGIICVSARIWTGSTMRRVLSGYSSRYAESTVAGIVNRWVGPQHTRLQKSEVRDYLLSVAQCLGVNPNQNIDLSDSFEQARVAYCIVYAENGTNPYAERLFRQAFGY